MLKFMLVHPHATREMLGLIPAFLQQADRRSAAEQFNERYAHGGGWRPFEGFSLRPNGCIKYPGDPEKWPLAQAKLRDETIRIYQGAWVMVLQPDGSFEISRMD